MQDNLSAPAWAQPTAGRQFRNTRNSFSLVVDSGKLMFYCLPWITRSSGIQLVHHDFDPTLHGRCTRISFLFTSCLPFVFLLWPMVHAGKSVRSLPGQSGTGKLCKCTHCECPQSPGTAGTPGADLTERVCEVRRCPRWTGRAEGGHRHSQGRRDGGVPGEAGDGEPTGLAAAEGLYVEHSGPPRVGPRPRSGEHGVRPQA